MFILKNRYTLDDLVLLTRRLRDKENGCPWDREQTHQSIRQNFIEEAYEAAEAIDCGDAGMLAEELGDVLLQVTLHAEIAKENGKFDINDVADGICKKLVLRHPHIFADVSAGTSERVLENWEDIKRGEKSQKTGSDAIGDVPKALPALMRGQKVQKRAGYVGFDYPDIDTAFSDLESEVGELKDVLGTEDVFEEVGDLIFAAVNVARMSGVDAELAAERACEKFARRFKIVEGLAAERGIDMKRCGIEVLNELWSKAKVALKKAE